MPTAHHFASDAACSACAELVASGAIITLPGLPLERMLVGEFRWLRDQLAFVFPAFGESVSDARLVPCDGIKVHAFGICFAFRGRITGLLSPIEKSAVEDPDDYRIAWTLWNEVVLIKRPALDSIIENCVKSSALPLTGYDDAA